MYKKDECASAKPGGELEGEAKTSDCDKTKVYVHDLSTLETCQKCHRPHFSAELALINKPIHTLCAECHDFKIYSFNKAHINIAPDVMDCRKCHEPHTSKDPMFFKEGMHPLFIARSCGDCHIVEK